MVLAYWIAAILTALVGVTQALKYTQTPNRSHLGLGLVFLIASGCLVYLAVTTKA